MPTTPFTAEHTALADSVRRLVDGPLAAAAVPAEAGALPEANVLQRCDEVGLFSLGDDILAATAVAQELGRLRSGGLVRVVLDSMLTAALGLRPVARFVAVVAEGAVDVSAAGASGVLPFVPGGTFAARVLVLHAAVLVDLAGVSREAASQAHALRGSAPASIQLEGVPCERVDIDPAAVARWELGLAAAAAAGGWQTWRDARDYAGQRHAFGRPIGRFQVNRHALADGAARLTAAEALVHEAAYALSLGDDVSTALPLLYATTAAADVADRALQLHGGNGYTTAFDVARSWRDARAGTTGASDLRERIVREGAQR